MFTLIDMLAQRAAAAPTARAFTFLVDGEREGAAFSYADIEQAARSIAAVLRERGVAPGERALLLYQPGLEFITAFFGCLYAGVIAVPCYPPHPAQLERTLPRLLAIAADSSPAVVLCSRSTVSLRQGVATHVPQLAVIEWMETDSVDSALADAWRHPGIRADACAFLQYTSGSTASPRGVIVSHANLLHNLEYARFVEENDESSVSVSWLPVIHDMGLIEGVLEPVYGGYPAYLMAPTAFLQRPVRWLRALAKYGATNSGGPNFAYDLCVRRITVDQRAELDLSAWRVAYNGAEPIRHDTLVAFHDAFRASGFRWSSFYPVYGLAEATLVVSSGRRRHEPVLMLADPEQLSQGALVPAPSGGERIRKLVSSGQVWCDTRVVIVDPESRLCCPPGRVGEIWIASPSVTRGYWNRPEESEDTFAATLSSGEGPFLRTGDLGAMIGAELFVTGRSKDVLIMRGAKHYPHDVEHTADLQHRAIRAGCCAAFAIDSDGAEAVVLAAEIDPRQLPVGPAARAVTLGDIAEAICAGVSEQHGIALQVISLVSLGGVPKTSSGKVRRSACRAAFLQGTLSELWRWTPPSTERGAYAVVADALSLRSV